MVDVWGKPARRGRLLGLFFVLFILEHRNAAAALYQTRNFEADAHEPRFAQQVARTAEQWYALHADYWTGASFPDLAWPIPVRVQTGWLGASGSTSFTFDRGEVYDWQMAVQGPPNRILDSVVPHETSHVILALHFGRAVPRWADEGIASIFENQAEKLKHLSKLANTDQEWMPLATLLQTKEYPKDREELLVFYAQGFTLIDFLLRTGDRNNSRPLSPQSYSEKNRRRLLQLISEWPTEEQSWNKAFLEHYETDLQTLDSEWKQYVRTVLFEQLTPARPTRIAAH